MQPVDFTIKIGAYSWQVHASIIQEDSDFFQRACNAPFKASLPLQYPSTFL